MVKELPVGVEMGWDMMPHLCFADGRILFGDADKYLYPEYWKDGAWPTDPVTHEKLPEFDRYAYDKQKRKRRC